MVESYIWPFMLHCHITSVALRHPKCTTVRPLHPTCRCSCILVRSVWSTCGCKTRMDHSSILSVFSKSWIQLIYSIYTTCILYPNVIFMYSPYVWYIILCLHVVLHVFVEKLLDKLLATWQTCKWSKAVNSPCICNAIFIRLTSHPITRHTLWPGICIWTGQVSGPQAHRCRACVWQWSCHVLGQSEASEHGLHKEGCKEGRPWEPEWPAWSLIHPILQRTWSWKKIGFGINLFVSVFYFLLFFGLGAAAAL